MNDVRIEIVKDIKPVDAGVYDAAISTYISAVSQNPDVKAVYQMGSVRDPGISDIDLIVVVDQAADPIQLQRLSIHQSGLPQGYRSLFLHDIYLHNTNTFNDLLYVNHCDNLKILHGEALPYREVADTDDKILAMQYIFDFVASRLAQFTSFLMSRKISYRGLLVRIASIKHSYSLLNTLDIHDKEIESFIEKTYRYRRNPDQVNESDALQLFLNAFYYYNRIVEHAAGFFQDYHLTFSSAVENANCLKLNPNFSIKFVNESTALYKSPRIENSIYYPEMVFYHYLGYTQTKTPFSDIVKWRLSCSGDEIYKLSSSYLNILNRRLSAIADHLRFIKASNAGFSMRGNPGFVADTIGEDLDAGHRYGPFLSTPEKSTITDRRKPTLDEVAKSIAYDELVDAKVCQAEKLQFDKVDYGKWVNAYFPEWPRRYGHPEHKKLIELFTTFQILAPIADDVYLDAAGGRNSYVDRIDCKKKILHVYQLNRYLQKQYPVDVQFIEGDAATLDLEDESISKISCHHSFEHFQQDSDIHFVKEVQRLLVPGGVCCIVPLFLADHYVEVTQDNDARLHFDPQSNFIVDPSARITGGKSCGDYARIYDLRSFAHRVLQQIDITGFDVRISEIYLDNKNVPDLTIACHKHITRINFPYRALTITRKKNENH